MKHFLLSLCLFLAPAFAAAQTFPDFNEVYVNDFADLLSAKQESAIRDKLVELYDARGIEFTVVTISSVSDYGFSVGIEPFATGLFNRWGVGDATRNDGLMILVARDDRNMRIEVGSGYGTSQNDAMKDIIEEDILPYFREGDYPAGISSGVDEVIFQITGVWPGQFDTNTAQRWLFRIWHLIESLGVWLYGIAGGTMAFVAEVYRRRLRSKPRICPIDRSKMTRLDEDWDDNHLQEGQILEEELKSVDYDVWQCAKCDHVTIEGYKAWFTRYGACRNCGFRTVEGDTTILEHATYKADGLKQIDYTCLHCKDAYSVKRVIPKKVKSSSGGSSGRSSFGGGRSGGGGASGSW